MSQEPNDESFCKSLFGGNLPQDMVFPFPKLKGAEADALGVILEALRRFAKEEVDSVRIDQEHHLGKPLLEALGQLGIFGLIIPEVYGGLGLSQTAYGRIFEELGRVDASIAVTIGAHSSIGLKGILLYGSDAQKQKYLPKLATGQHIAAFALTEPGAGSDAYSIRTRAVKQADGSYVLNGNKIWITNGGIAHVFTVFAKTEVETPSGKKDKVTAFIVTADMPGVSHGAEEKKMGIRGSSTTEMHFENVKVPAENVLGEEGKGFKIAMEVLNSGRLGLATGSVGGAKEMLRLAVNHAKERKQFGKPIAEFGMIKEKLGQMAIDIYAVESMAYLTCGLVDQGVEDYSLESALCKFAASEMLWQVANEATQIAGGSSYMQEYPYERMLRDARINMIFEGTNEILRSYTALAGMRGVSEYLKTVGQALNEPIKGFGVLYDYVVSRAPVARSFYGDRLTRAHQDLKLEASMVETYVIDFARSVERAVLRHREKIFEKQFTQKRMAEMVKELYLMTAVISRTTDALDSKHADAAMLLSMAQVACQQAGRRFRKNLRDMDRNLDEPIKEISDWACQRQGFPLDQ